LKIERARAGEFLRKDSLIEWLMEVVAFLWELPSNSLWAIL